MKRKLLRRLCSASSALAFAAAAAHADIVTLQSIDGNISIQGTILSFDGETYEFDSAIGVTRFPAAPVICIGDACPAIVTGALQAGVGVVDAAADQLLAGLVGAYASDRGLTVLTETGTAEATSFGLKDASDQSAGAVTVLSQSERAAFEGLLSGQTEVVLTSSPISDALAEDLVRQGHPDMREAGREVIIALDAVVPIVHPSNPVRDLSLPTLARIAAGRIDNWSELGGPDLPIRLAIPGEGSAVYDMVDKQIMRPNRLRLDRDLAFVADEAAAVRAVNEDPAAISLASGALADRVKVLPIRQVCGPLSMPTTFSVQAEEYPLARRVLMYTADRQLDESMKDFISYAGSADAQRKYTSAGFVGQTIEAVPMSLQGSRLASAILFADAPKVFDTTRNLTETLKLADRLSTTFRFEAGTAELDNKSQRDAVRIAAYLLEPENANRNILLLGFTDSVGRADLNEMLTLQQASGIRDAIVRASAGRIGADRIAVGSYGSIAPVGCNETIEGRLSNRRVEVWLR